jgi:hypothetical protein
MEIDHHYQPDRQIDPRPDPSDRPAALNLHRPSTSLPPPPPSPRVTMLAVAVVLNMGAVTSVSQPAVELVRYPVLTHESILNNSISSSNSSSGVVLDSGCIIGTLREDCPAEYPRRVENGNGIYRGPHSAYVGMSNPGSLEVPSGEAACCQGAGWLYVNPPPGSGIPAGCTGTGTMISEGVRIFQITRFLDYTNDCSPPPGGADGTCRFPGASTGDGCRQLSCFQCKRDNPDDCYCVPQGLLHGAFAPPTFMGGPC